VKKKVLIAGSSRGIGRATALRLARDGFSVTLHGKTHSQALEDTLQAVREYDAEVRSLAFDVSDRDAARSALEAEIARSGAFYGVVLSAGFTKDMPLAGMDDAVWDAVIDVDLHGFYNVLRPLVLPMIQLRSGGRIVSLSSLSGIIGNRGQVHYSAAKAGLIGASKALARELAKRNITVNCVAPGAVETDMLDEVVRGELLKTVPMGRFGTPEEIAGAVSYLFSDVAGYMTGQTLVISGGLF
jgi:3-oxoacyl-[acyl-carrier protein] reductase